MDFTSLLGGMGGMAGGGGGASSSASASSKSDASGSDVYGAVASPFMAIQPSETGNSPILAYGIFAVLIITIVLALSRK